MLQLASKIEVFSYLSPEAAEEILNYVEYVDLSSEPVGKLIFDNNTLDGSLYAVISGEATIILTIHKNGNGAQDVRQSFKFVAGQGEVMTSLLTLLSSLVREYQLQEAFISSPIPGLIGSEFISVDVNGNPTTTNKRSLIPDGFDIRAVISSPNTILMRIPSRCFVNILDQYPKDVCQICQTIVARLQRVTIQSLVPFLGLGDEVLGTGSRGYQHGNALPERKPRKTKKWKQFEESLSTESSVNPSMLDQAISSAASLLGLPAEKCDILKDGASVVSFPPGGIICKPGEAPDAVYLVMKGSLEVSYGKNNNITAPVGEPQPLNRRNEYACRVDEGQNGKPFFKAGPGTFVGLFSIFTGDSSFINVHNSMSGGNAWLLKISSNAFDKVVSTNPRALIHCLLDILDTIGSSPSVYLLGKLIIALIPRMKTVVSKLLAFRPYTQTGRLTGFMSMLVKALSRRANCVIQYLWC